MWITFAVFMLVVAYICYRRLPFVQVHRLVSLGYRLAAGGGAETANASVGGHVGADGPVAETRAADGVAAEPLAMIDNRTAEAAEEL